jgi:cytochrome c553
MSTDATFPLPWEQILWSAQPAFPVRLWRTHTYYAFTNFRLVVKRRNRTIDELALADIDSVSLTQTWWQRAAGTSTVHVSSTRRDSAMQLANIHHGPQLALVLQLRATELFGDEMNLDADFFRTALGPGTPPLLRPYRAIALAATVVLAAAFGVIQLARHSSLPPVVYAFDDSIVPRGSRRSAEEIFTFMEREVMPFAREALGPIVGGKDNVTCETCHGADAKQRNWQMPGVRALPEPALRLAGLEHAGSSVDPQMRNAVYGYLAEEDKQSIAAYMRQVVMPGMAKLMHRPAYDFAKSYGYNRSRAAVGCYHCHLVE